MVTPSRHSLGFRGGNSELCLGDGRQALVDGGRGGMDQVARFLDAPSVQFQLVHAARGSGGGGCYGVDGGGHHVHTGPVVPPGRGGV